MKGLGAALVAAIGIGLLYLAATGRLGNLTTAFANLSGTPTPQGGSTGPGTTGTGGGGPGL